MDIGEAAVINTDEDVAERSEAESEAEDAAEEMTGEEMAAAAAVAVAVAAMKSMKENSARMLSLLARQLK
tara:strand:- start:81 stop:290 length:210 start_codon:yes stop_codon:yes gene_type:complete